MKLFDAIYHIEEWREGQDFDELTDRDLVDVAGYLIVNLRGDHAIPGAVWYKMMGIRDWYNANGFITTKQAYWLMIHLNQYLDQRDFEKEFY